MKYFGTDGFRGEANVNLNVMHAYKVGRFLGWYYGKEHKARVVIGKDTRRSSYMFEDALCAGLTASGADVYLLHVTPTPSVSYVVRTEKFDCGIMISASHNPYYDNGLKVINGKGHKMEAEVEEKIEAYIDSEVDDIPMATRENIGCTIDYAIGRHRYIGYLMSLATRSFKNIKVGLDCANGSSYSVAKGVFDALGAQTFAIGMNPDGTNINDNCGSTHIDNLQKFVVENNLDVGFAYDGDADRCLAVDETGKVVDGDQMIAICAKALKASGKLEKDTAVVTVMTNLGFFHFTKREGIHAVATKVGDRYVLEEMKKGGYCIGGEQSGHIIFLEHATTGDGELSGAKLVEIVKQSGKKLSELAGEMETFPQQMQNVRITADQRNRWKEDEAVCSVMKQYEERLGEDGRILVRESGTEPLIRVMVEAKDADLMQEAVSAIAEELERYTKR